jgi:hypothetical protein
MANAVGLAGKELLIGFGFPVLALLERAPELTFLQAITRSAEP